ncbi:MAG: hypothetical protein NVS2B4_07760 [Ramlibacter sp.]
MTDNDRTDQWLAAERAAILAEKKVADLGQGARHPRVANLCLEAGTLRRQADSLFTSLRSHLRGEDTSP